MTDKDRLAYAIERATATRRPYFITNLGHVLLDCAHNRRVTREIGCTVARVVRPQKGNAHGF